MPQSTRQFSWIAVVVVLGGQSASKAGWQQLETANFRVHYCGSKELARKVGAQAEEQLGELAIRWLGRPDARLPIVCELILHPTREAYLRAVGPALSLSAGCSTIRVERGRVMVLWVDLDASYPKRIEGVLPHELSHVILAERFAELPAPRWADEGIAILAEPAAKQGLRRKDLADAIRAQTDFRLAELLGLETYPAPSRQRAFYGQSASVVEFFLKRGSGPQFLNFLDAASRRGYATALKESYQIDDISGLEEEWRRHVSEAVAALTPSPTADI